VDCFRFTVSGGGVIDIVTNDADSPGCTNFDYYSVLYLLSDGATSIYDYIAVDYGYSGCPRINYEIGPGAYLACHENSYSFGGYPDDMRMNISFTPFVCGNDIVDPGEECDGTTLCTPDCFFDDGVAREDEILGNNTRDAPGVKILTIDEKARGNVLGNDVDWWALPLPGDLGIGAVRILMTGIDDASCGTAGAARVDIFGLDDENNPIATSTIMSPCRATTLTTLQGEPVFGNEQLFVRVSSTTAAFATYTLLPTYIPEECNNGIIEPSEQCEPTDPDLGDRCDSATCRLLPPNNETCADAQLIDVASDGTATVVDGDLRGAAPAARSDAPLPRSAPRPAVRERPPDPPPTARAPRPRCDGAR
jgi:hypothetical protein